MAELLVMDYATQNKVRRNIKLITLVSAALVSIFALNAFISALILRDNIIKARVDQVANLTEILSAHTTQAIYSANTALQSLDEIEKFSEITTEKEFIHFASQKQQYNLLLDKVKSNPILDVATFVDNNGKVLNFTRSFPPPDINLADRDYFQWLSKHDDSATYFSLPVRNKGTGKWVFYLAKRVNGARHEFLGLILVGVSVEIFSSLYENIGMSLGEGSSVVLYRDDHRLLTQWPLVDNLIGGLNTGGLIQSSLSQENIDDGVIITDLPGFTRGSNPGERMLSYRKVEGYPLIVGAIVSKQIYLARWYSALISLAYTTLFSIAIICLGAYLLIRAYKRNAKAQYFAHHDVLTKLPNRLFFSDRLEQALDRARKSNEKLALLFIDLDNLKTTNDVYSHGVGDGLLITVAKRMMGAIRDVDIIGRVGGDEFVVLLPKVESEKDAYVVAEKIRSAISMPITLDNLVLHTSVSIGIALFPDHALDDVELMKNADAAMYLAKNTGKNNIQIYSGPKPIKSSL